MKKLLFISLLVLFSSFSSQAYNIAIDPNNLFPKVKFETNMGDIIVELDRIKAPLTVDNFLTYVVAGEYNNTVFHRVIADFIVQGGGYDSSYAIKDSKGSIANESGNGLKNDKGTIAMAKESQPHTANRQFFFNVADNDSLNPGRQWGYAVFGNIVKGLEVIEKMAQVKTDYSDELGWEDVPTEQIILKKVILLPAE